MDYAHKKTEGMLSSLEKRLAHEYAQAERELTDKLDDYMWRHSVKDRIWLNKVANGEITWERYQQWKIGQVCIGERWTEMRDTIAEDMHHTNEIAGSIVNGYLPEVYALNHNYATYEAEVGALVDTSYTLYDRQTVERMMRDNPDMLPPPGKRVSERIRAGKDVRWNEQQIQSIATQSILQGEDLMQTANRLRSTFGDSFTIDDIKNIEHKTASQIAKELTKKNKSAAIRNARTMMTGAQNAGRVDGYKRAKDMGIDIRQQWLATLDGRTRHEHRQLDGQIVEVGEPFKVDGYEIRFPGDPTAEAHLVYNCRCTLIAAIKGFEHDLSDTSSRYDANLEGMTYEEWKNEKAKAPKPEKTTAERGMTGEGIAALRKIAQSSTDKFEFWMSMDENQQAIFKASGMSLDDAFNELHSGGAVSEWKPPAPGGAESFAIEFDASAHGLEYKAIPARSDGWMADATTSGVINIREDGLGDNWDFIIAHEAGHQVSNMSTELQQTIIQNPGNILGRYNTKYMAFDGIYGEYNPEEAFATGVSNYVRHPDSMREKYPEAYKAFDTLFKTSPSALEYVRQAMDKYKMEFM